MYLHFEHISTMSLHIFDWPYIWQDSPPTGNCKRRTVRGITCPKRNLSGGARGYPSSTQGDTPAQGRVPWYCCCVAEGLYPSPAPGRRGGTPVLSWGELPPRTGAPPAETRVPPLLDGTWGCPLPIKNMGPVFGSIMGWRWGTTPVLTHRHL